MFVPGSYIHKSFLKLEEVSLPPYSQSLPELSLHSAGSYNAGGSLAAFAVPCVPNVPFDPGEFGPCIHVHSPAWAKHNNEIHDNKMKVYIFFMLQAFDLQS